MGTARMIPPKANFPPKLKVAAYCRVSTNTAEQLSSLAMQEQYYEKHIKQNPDWIFAGVYSDIGSGTRRTGRSRFKVLLSACQRGKVDMILTKSAHRFARDTVDALKTIRMLRSWNVAIHFERENIHSLYETSEIMLMLICALAQDESYSKSEDIKWGLRKSFQNPDSKYYQRICYGYTHDQDDKLIIHIAHPRFRLDFQGKFDKPAVYHLEKERRRFYEFAKLCGALADLKIGGTGTIGYHCDSFVVFDGNLDQ